ncbi:MAG: hypothetical protein OEY89_15085, partial [Gammaproteobacteria bacterium]|nr:hypothetical protein [Gammaproteobacteria bacterium]
MQKELKEMSNDYLESIKNLKISLDNWAGITVENTERDLSKSIISSIISSNAVFDKFNTWLLAGTGVTIALVISNIDKLSQLNNAGIGTYKNSIYILLASVILGLFAKAISVQIQTHLKIEENLKHVVKEIYKKHDRESEKIENMAKENKLVIETEINVYNVIKPIIDSMPSYLAKKF